MNCKPGDIAVVVRAGKFPENIGALVKVLGAVSEEKRAIGVTVDWEVEVLSRVKTVAVTRGGATTEISAGETAYWPDSHLRPLQPPPEDEEIDEREPVLVETKP